MTIQEQIAIFFRNGGVGVWYPPHCSAILPKPPSPTDKEQKIVRPAYVTATKVEDILTLIL